MPGVLRIYCKSLAATPLHLLLSWGLGEEEDCKGQ
jgi:hypothetical protein